MEENKKQELEEMQIKTFINYEFQSNCYVVTLNGDTYVIDPGSLKMGDVDNYIKDNNLNLKAILLTHGHVDHIIGIPEILEVKKVPVYISEKDYNFLYNPNLSLTTWLRVNFVLDKDVKVITMKENDKVFNFDIIETPGHTHGGVAFYDKDRKILFSGDTIFKGTYGRYDLPTGSYTDLKNSIAKLMKLDGETLVYPGHMTTTTIKEERPLHGF